MATSIGKLSKSFFLKLLVGIIILPFVFWGMGDVFRGGSQNVIAKVDSEKISTQEFVRYINQLNLNKEQMKSLAETNLLEEILSEFIGRKVMAIEIKKIGITVSDNSLRDIIKNDNLFIKDKKFSRTEYEKFLISSGITAPSFESNIAKQESRRQFLSSLSGGIVIPNSLVEKTFNLENQIKEIKYIDLNKFYSKEKPSAEEIKKVFEKNKNSFIKELKSIKYAEITPQIISGNNEYNDSFFKQLDILENNILDGLSFNEAATTNNLNIIEIDNIDKNKRDENENLIKDLPDKLFEKVYKIKNKKSPEVFKIDNKFYLAEVVSIKKINRTIEDKEVLKLINAQLMFKNKIKLNTEIAKDLSLGALNDENELIKFANQNNLELKDYKINNLKQNEIFPEGFIKKIFILEDGKVDLITDNMLNKAFLVIPIKTNYKKLKKDSTEFEKYEAKARLNLINKIFNTYDQSLNQKYNVELNERTINRVKNSF